MMADVNGLLGYSLMYGFTYVPINRYQTTRSTKTRDVPGGSYATRNAQAIFTLGLEHSIPVILQSLHHWMRMLSYNIIENMHYISPSVIK